jgi:serine/threonine protein phosphatase PrpC
VSGVPWLSVPERDAPSWTIVAALWDGVDVTVGWAGDSRAYWLDPSGCRRLTTDHSWAEEEVRAGRLSRAAAEADGRAHAITRWLGADAVPQDFPLQTLRPTDAGHLVVCTDGLWNYLPRDGDLERVMTTAPGDGSPVAAARSLVRHALASGGHDNVTVAVAAIDPRPRATPARPVERGS